MEIVSLFDGISCGRVALERAGISVDRYDAYEIEPSAIAISKKNYPDIVQHGSVEGADFTQYECCDLLIGGSPCQGFSNAGKGLNFDDPRSKLFWEFVRAIKEAKPKYFLLENVCMKKEWEQVITDALGVEPILINSALVSAQNRRRLYWTNIPNVCQPNDKGITWGMIREHDVPMGNMYYTERGLACMHRFEEARKKRIKVFDDSDKMQMLEKSMHKKYSGQRLFAIPDTHGWRYITPLECERCQTLPDGYTEGVSNTARYIALGNGWTVDVIAHILSNIPK